MTDETRMTPEQELVHYAVLGKWYAQTFAGQFQAPKIERSANTTALAVLNEIAGKRGRIGYTMIKLPGEPGMLSPTVEDL